jgi:hypothetical protein
LSCPAQAGLPAVCAPRLKPKRCLAEGPAFTGSSAFADDDKASSVSYAQAMDQETF